MMREGEVISESKCFGTKHPTVEVLGHPKKIRLSVEEIYGDFETPAI